jgi:hypothetical protein
MMEGACRSYENGFMRLEDSAKPLRPFSRIIQPATVSSRSASRSDSPGRRRSEHLSMFCIMAETCRRFTLAEILIMAAINVKPLFTSLNLKLKTHP